jgi:7,8-dihydropterin-6-yl-methyl-4-(beta-D-ribofuranosyl)aminobenzene 5'-phosphate synthase
MKITVLAENTSALESLGSEHGLSILIEMKNAVILFDTGCGGLFLENAEKLGLDLKKVTHLILSHGHYDHGGGIPAFLEVNRKANIYLRREAFTFHYAVRVGDVTDDIGLPQELRGNPRLVFTHDAMAVTQGVTLYSDIRLREPIPDTNRNLMMNRNGHLAPDDFLHEQVAEFREREKTLLVTGCSHHGIVNILKDYQEKTERTPDAVIGGFHLHSHTHGRAEDSVIDSVAAYLAGTSAQYYTCHCTGLPAYEELRKQLGEQIQYISGGQTLML